MTYRIISQLCSEYINILYFTKMFVLQKNLRIRVLVFNATFNNISAISLRIVLLVEKIGVPGENRRLAANHGKTLHNVVSRRITG
jgi:hypothetical protein